MIVNNKGIPVSFTKITHGCLLKSPDFFLEKNYILIFNKLTSYKTKCILL